MLEKVKYAALFFSLLFLTQCKEGGKFDFISPPEVVDSDKSSIARSTWQKPGEVIDLLGDISGKKIADVGAGSGYFTFRMAIKGADVIALEIDPTMIDLIESFKTNLPVDVQFNIESRMVEEDDPKLEDEEVDIAVIINTIAYIKDKKAYLSKLKRGLKKDSKVMIIDFKNVSNPYNSSSSPTASIEEVEEALSEAGFQNIVVNSYTLDYQYVIFADCKNMMFQ